MKLSSVLLLVVGALAFAAVGWFGNEVFGHRAGPAKDVAVPCPAVRAGVAKMVSFNPEREYVGHVEPVQETDILPQIDGYVKKVCFAEGALVRAGDILFEIDPEQYVAARNLRYSEVRSAEAKVTVAEAEVDRAKRYYARLAAADDRGITATELDTAETTLASAKAALNAARAAVEQAKASAALADFNMKHTAIRSPISGRIGKAFRHVGDFVSPSKSPLAQVVQTDPVRVVFPITDKEYGSWRAAAEAGGARLEDSRRLRLRLPDGRIYAHEGVLAFGDNKVDAGTATVNLRARFANGTDELLPNAFVRVIGDERNPPQRLVVPADAVERTAKGTHVWILGADGTVRAQPVSVGASWRGMTIVSEGIVEGAKVVVAGGFKLKDGMKVSVSE